MSKRKLTEEDSPAVEERPQKTARSAKATEETSFDTFGLDSRLLRGVIQEKWAKATLVQARVIPKALEGKDILARSSTGSGKTAAYLIPILESTLRRKASQPKATSSLILVPTKELAVQVTKMTQSLASYCGQDIRVENIAGKEAEVVLKSKLQELPDIVVATPARASAHANNGSLALANLAHLVIDEADLLISFGSEDDLATIAEVIPKGVQIFLMSATLNTELESVRKLVCRDPVIISLDDEEKDASNVKQYVIRCGEEEKFLLIYAMFILKIISGSTIIFTGDIDRGYRVKLFLEQFGIKSVCLNSELPLASRAHILEEFNRGTANILIASDENEVVGTRRDPVEGEEEAAETDGSNEKTETTAEAKPLPNKAKDSKEQKKKQRNKHKKDKDSGVSRGIDFLNVAYIINFDMPMTWKSYFHRIGRTARAGKTGTAISFVVPKDLFRKHKPTSFPGCENDEQVLAKITKHQKEGQTIENWEFDKAKLEPFRYRLTDALRNVTRVAIREARIREIRQELIKSEKLTRFFEEDPSILQHLRHDGEVRTARTMPHLRHVPDYLLPGGKKATAEDVGFVGLQKDLGRGDGNRIRRNRAINKAKGRGRKVGGGKGGKVDPLKSFKTRQKGKK